MRDEFGIPPTHPTSVQMTIDDAWGGGIFCPFCGTETRKRVAGGYEAAECEHLLCFEDVDGATFVADRLKDEILASGFDISKKGAVFTAKGKGADLSVNPASFAGLFPNSIIFIVSNSLDVIDWTYCYAPKMFEWKP